MKAVLLAQDATLADMFAAVWGDLNAAQGRALLAATDAEPERPFGAAIDYLTTIGICLVPTAPAFHAMGTATIVEEHNCDCEFVIGRIGHPEDTTKRRVRSPECPIHSKVGS